jgi:hypothetical protein
MRSRIQRAGGRDAHPNLMKNRSFPSRLFLPLAAALLAHVFPVARALEYVVLAGPVTVDTRRADLRAARLDTPLQAAAASSQTVA